MASLLGITTPKYQYAIDEYYRMKKDVCTPLLLFYSLHLLANILRGSMYVYYCTCFEGFEQIP